MKVDGFISGGRPRTKKDMSALAEVVLWYPHENGIEKHAKAFILFLPCPTPGTKSNTHRSRTLTNERSHGNTRQTSYTRTPTAGITSARQGATGGLTRRVGVPTAARIARRRSTQQQLGAGNAKENRRMVSRECLDSLRLT